MSENNGGIKLAVGGATLITLLAGGIGWLINKFEDINRIFYERNARITVLEYQIKELERRQAQDDEVRKRLNALERK